MDTTKTLIERLRAQLGNATNYRLAKHLGISKPSLIKYVHERGGMAFEIGLRVGAELGLDPDYVLLCLAAEREQSPEVKTRWQRLASQASGQTARPGQRTRRVSKVAAVLLTTGLAAISATLPRQASAGECAGFVYSVKSRSARRTSHFPRPPRRRRWDHVRRRDRKTLPAAIPITS